MSASAPPHSEQVEQAVVGQLLANPKLVPEVVGTLLEPRHFYTAGSRALYEAIYARFYSDDPIDPLSIGNALSRPLASAWGVAEEQAVLQVQQMAQASRWRGDVTDHAKVVKRDADYRDLLSVSASMQQAVETGDLGPEEIASIASKEAMEIATSAVRLQELQSYGDAGREFVREMRRVMAAHAQGVELGARFGLAFIDDYTYGLQPTELLVAAGEPGVGKSLVWGRAMQNFAERQALVAAKLAPGQKPVGTLILNLEMGRWPSYIRLAQMVSGVPGREMRTGELPGDKLNMIVKEWGRRKDIPLWFNFASHLRESQLRALVVEGIQKHNIGLVMIDHMRMIDTDRFIKDVNERDEAKVRFLKESLAEDLNVAVICLAHSVKMTGDDKRPQMSHLRGSGQIAAHADFVNFIYRPYDYASEKSRDAGEILPTDAEMLWRKNRHDKHGVADFYFNPDTMTIH